MTKYFVFEEHSVYSKNVDLKPIPPYFTSWQKILGKTTGPFSLEQILSIDLSESIRKRINGLRENSHVKICYASANSSFHLRRISDDEVAKAATIKQLKADLAEVTAKINESIPADLKRKKYELEKQLNSIK